MALLNFAKEKAKYSTPPLYPKDVRFIDKVNFNQGKALIYYFFKEREHHFYYIFVSNQNEKVTSHCYRTKFACYQCLKIFANTILKEDLPKTKFNQML